MAGRFTKYNGATEVIDRGASRPRPDELRRFKPDFYDPYRKPIRSPNLLQYKAERTFGKRIVEEAAKQVARRAPLALAGPLGDLLALGLITWDMYLLLLELQNQANPVPGVGPPADPNSDPYGEPPYDLNHPGWYHGQTAVYPPSGTSWVQTGPELVLYNNNPRVDYPNLGAPVDAPGNVHADYQADYSPGPVDSLNYYVPVHNTDTNADGWWVTHGVWWIDLGTDPGVSYQGHGTPLVDSLPFDWAEPDPNMKREMFPDGVLEPSEDERDAPPPRYRAPRPAPPPRGTREAPKAQGPLQTIMKAMDIISEAAEFVDALYDALPDDVRKRWDEKGRGLIDNAGQYGIDGADWKLNALWHNWHKVDIEQAIKNIIANEFQDKILGKYQQALPKNIGHVADVGSLGLNDLIDLFNRTVGLS